MQVNPFYPHHVKLKECQVGVECQKQCETVISSALALREQFMICGDVLERVEVFKYLGWMMVQDNNDIQAVRSQLRKARATWAWVGQVLHSENVTPFMAARFYDTRLSSKPSSSTAARHGFSLEPPWRVLRDFTFKLRIGWQRNTSQSAAQVMYGFIQGQRMSCGSAG